MPVVYKSKELYKLPVGCFNHTESLQTTKKTWPVMFNSDPGPTKRGKPILKADTG